MQGIFSGIGNGHVKGGICLGTQSTGVNFRLHFMNCLFHGRDIGSIRPFGSKSRCIAFQTHPDFQEIIQRGILGLHGFGQGVFKGGINGFDKGSLPLFLIDQPHGHQPLDGIPDGGPTDLHCLGQLPFRQHLFTGFELPPVDQFPDLVKDLV